MSIESNSRVVVNFLTQKVYVDHGKRHRKERVVRKFDQFMVRGTIENICFLNVDILMVTTDYAGILFVSEEPGQSISHCEIENSHILNSSCRSERLLRLRKSLKIAVSNAINVCTHLSWWMPRYFPRPSNRSFTLCRTNLLQLPMLSISSEFELPLQIQSTG